MPCHVLEMDNGCTAQFITLDEEGPKSFRTTSNAGTKSVGEISWCSVQPGHCKLDVEVRTRLPMHFAQTSLLQGVFIGLSTTHPQILHCRSCNEREEASARNREREREAS